MSDRLRITVCALGMPGRPGELPGSRVGEHRAFPSGGERSLYELATAAASLGHDVELRGDLNGPVLEAITSAAGAAPRTGHEPRAAALGEIVVVPEGMPEIDGYLVTALSGARPILYLLGPPGLWGWSFLESWTRPDPSIVPLDEIGTPASFRSIDALGYSMWTNAHGIADAAAAAGVTSTWIGTGTPVPFPEPHQRTYDVAVIEENRWHGAATSVAAKLEGVSVLRIGPVASTYSLCRHLAAARVLIWPSRVEGMSRIAREARAVGTVPVTLDTNPFVTLDDHGEGVVLVSDLDEMVLEVRRLLGDRGRLEALSDAGRDSVGAQADWQSFRSRVANALESLEVIQPGDEQRAAVGHLLRPHLDEARALLEASEARSARLQAALDSEAARSRVALRELDETAHELLSERARAESLAQALSEAQEELGAFSKRRAVRIADTLAIRRRSPAPATRQWLRPARNRREAE